MSKAIIQAADLFCGAGGTSTGLMEAAAELGLAVDLLAVNHWEVAIATHSANHPAARHLCKSIEGVNPRVVVPGGRLDLLVASPECVHFSNARGGKAMSDQSRATAWNILHWAEALEIDALLIENVKEFRDWGPLYESASADKRLHPPTPKLDGRPIPERKGEYFGLFLRNLRALGYSVDHRLLRAADYGDATTRVRLFVQARKGKRRRITWPAATHVPANRLALTEGARPWRAAREIIDWTIPGESIYSRKKPLSPNTMKRIMAGLRKFSGLPFVVVSRTGNSPHSLNDPLQALCTNDHMALCEPFLVILRNNQTAQSVDDPLKTLTANVRQFALCEPYLVGFGGPEGQGRTPASIDEPLGTVLGENHRGVVQPFVVAMEHGGAENGHDGRTYDIDRPLPTVTAKGDLALCQFLLKQFNTSSPFQSVDDPLSSVTAEFNHHGLVKAFLVPYHGEREGEAPRTGDVDAPIGTQDTSNRFGLCQPFLVPYRSEGDGQKERVHSVDEPAPTIATGHNFGVCTPFLIAYHGSEDGADSVEEPLRTIDTRDRHALVESGLIEKGDRVYLLDIRFRMLKPHELAAAHSFPAGYRFTGNQDQQVKQIGNSVPKELSKALVREMLRSRV